MVYDSIKTHMALTTAYISFEIRLALAKVNILIKMHLASNSILEFVFETLTKSSMPFKQWKFCFTII
jgi:hypothetical protein